MKSQETKEDGGTDSLCNRCIFSFKDREPTLCLDCFKPPPLHVQNVMITVLHNSIQQSCLVLTKNVPTPSIYRWTFSDSFVRLLFESDCLQGKERIISSAYQQGVEKRVGLFQLLIRHYGYVLEPRIYWEYIFQLNSELDTSPWVQFLLAEGCPFDFGGGLLRWTFQDVISVQLMISGKFDWRSAVKTMEWVVAHGAQPYIPYQISEIPHPDWLQNLSEGSHVLIRKSKWTNLWLNGIVSEVYLTHVTVKYGTFETSVPRNVGMLRSMSSNKFTVIPPSKYSYLGVPDLNYPSSYQRAVEKQPSFGDAMIRGHKKWLSLRDEWFTLICDGTSLPSILTDLIYEYHASSYIYSSCAQYKL